MNRGLAGREDKEVDDDTVVVDGNFVSCGAFGAFEWHGDANILVTFLR